MRLSLRLMAERGGRADRLGFYLDDPIQLFLPARLLLGIIFSLSTMFIVLLTGRVGLRSIGFLLLFDVVARFLHPLTGPLVKLIAGEGRRERTDVPVNNAPTAAESGTAAEEADAAEDQDLIEGDRRKLLQSIVDFGDTLVREVMTPRPDMVAIRADATLDDLRALFREQEYSRIPVYNENLDNIAGMVFVKDLIRLTGAEVGTMRLDRDLQRLVRPATFVPE